MKQGIAIAVAAGLAGVLAAVALGSSTTYTGEALTDPDATIKLKITDGDERRVKQVIVEGIQYSGGLCTSSGRTPKATLKGDFRVKGNGEFRAVGGAETNNPFDGRAAERGRRGDQAQGHRRHEVHLRQGRLRVQRRRLQGDEIAEELDLAAIEASLRERLAEIDSEIAELTKPPENASGISFGKRIGDGTSQAIDRFADVGVAQEIEPLKERIERALAKLEEGTYGTCDSCGKEIVAGRLKAAPESALCIDCARTKR